MEVAKKETGAIVTEQGINTDGFIPISFCHPSVLRLSLYPCVVLPVKSSFAVRLGGRRSDAFADPGMTMITMVMTMTRWRGATGSNDGVCGVERAAPWETMPAEFPLRLFGTV